MDESDIKTAIETITSIVNSHDDVSKPMLESLLNQHRTLQQRFWKNIFKLIQNYGQEKYFDLRNEQATETCRKIDRAMTESYGEYWWHCPTI